MSALKDVRRIPDYAVIVRAVWCRGQDQQAALAELLSRGLLRRDVGADRGGRRGRAAGEGLMREPWMTYDELLDRLYERRLRFFDRVVGVALFLAVCYFARGLLL